MNKLATAFALALVSGIFLMGCFKNPITGRSSLSLVDETTMRQMAQQEYAQFLAQHPPVKGTRDAEMVHRVGGRIAKAVEDYLKARGQQHLVAQYQWQYELVNENAANAWCMPGGKIVVYSGIMPVVQHEAGLAVVMGHEVAHAIARHSNERVSQQLAAQFGNQALSGILSSNPSAASDIFQAAVGIGTQGMLLKYSRDQESEADKMGLIFMAMAGYNPQEALHFWERMAVASSAPNPPEILSTHPSHQRRIADIKALLPEAMTYYKPH